jgi:hypothetical protein
MDKTNFWETKNNLDDSKIVYQFVKPYHGNRQIDFGNTISLHLLDLLVHYGVDINNHINSTSFYYESEENKGLTLFINVNLKDGKVSKSYIRSKIGILKKVQDTPIHVEVIGKGSSYPFLHYNITDNLDDLADGLFLFTMQVEDKRPNIEFSHSILKFESVSGNSKEVIAQAKLNGAVHVLYSDFDSMFRMQDIIEDIKAGENYKHQIALYPETAYIP